MLYILIPVDELVKYILVIIYNLFLNYLRQLVRNNFLSKILRRLYMNKEENHMLLKFHMRFNIIWKENNYYFLFYFLNLSFVAATLIITSHALLLTSQFRQFL